MSKGRKKRRAYFKKQNELKKSEVDQFNTAVVSTDSNSDATLHAFERKVRIAEVEDIVDVQKVFNLALALAKKSKTDSEAIRIVKLPLQHNRPWSDVSNGDEIWALVRRNRLVTMMFRRSTQPKTVESLRVNKVTLI